MIDKEWHRDRIEELKFEGQGYYDIQRIIITIILGFTALFLAILSIYFKEKEKYIIQILLSADVFL